MLDKIHPLHQLATLNFGIVLRTMEEITEEQALKPVSPKTNCPNWMLGHLVAGRHFLINLAGGSTDVPPMGEAYERGSTAGPDAKYRPLAEIKEAWERIADDLNTALDQVDSETLAVRQPRELPLRDKTVWGALTFVTYHEAYHVGQLAMVRKELGLEGIFG